MRRVLALITRLLLLIREVLVRVLKNERVLGDGSVLSGQESFYEMQSRVVACILRGVLIGKWLYIGYMTLYPCKL